MKVLSIDLDYIMGPTIEIYQHHEDDDNDPLLRWDNLFNGSNFRKGDLRHDSSSFLYCYDIFLKGLKSNPTVSFGYDHDAILYAIKDYSDIDLINIDHHDDVMHCGGSSPIADSMDLEYHTVATHNRVNEGNWVAWLHAKNKLNSYTWIHNKNSGNLNRNFFNIELLGDKYKWSLRKDYTFKDYNFDHIFVCLSPIWVPPFYWHYYTLMMMTYQQISGNKVDLVCKKKFEYEVHYDEL